ncbi:halocin C8-like domain-containing protein [Natrarchaeobius oligotrophus]|uniref:Halocin C8 n=1 Tax=Natrarchaeobius chitinivorans TaxID=1679083 RepID=A0A3N6M7T8_NATCH|nr:halocin C8-like domain-containing protein [Natrarchaeobius chitinivorans]RQG96724.1 hypothetical protein EA472_20435 [Natrarchaeobius chitinivorans]
MIGTAGATEPDELLTGSEVRQYTAASRRSDESRKLYQNLNEKGFNPAMHDAVAIPVSAGDLSLEERAEVDIDSGEFEQLDPVSLFVPFHSEDEEEIALLNALIVESEDGNGRHVPVAAWAFVVSGEQNEESGEIDFTVDVVAFEESNAGVATADDETSDVGTADAGTTDSSRDVESIDEFTVSRSMSELEGESEAGTQSLPSVPGVISAGLCIAVVSEVCDRYGDQVQRSACARICLRTANPVAAGGCAAFCLAVVEVIDRYGCQRSGDFLCAALGFSV